MTRAEIERRLRLWQTRLGLDGWLLELDVDETAAGENTVAAIQRASSYRHAVIRLGADWRSWTAERAGNAYTEEQLPPRSLDHYLLHELIHLHLHDLQIAAHALEDEVLPAAGRVAEERVEHELERAVDELARAFGRAYGEV